MVEFHRITDEEAARNLAENRMLVQLPHDEWCELNLLRVEQEWWKLTIECRCMTRDVVAKLREMGWTDG